jgi:hypothetical protein
MNNMANSLWLNTGVSGKVIAKQLLVVRVMSLLHMRDSLWL